MRKQILAFLSLVLALGLVACNRGNNPTIKVENIITLRTSMSFEYQVMDKEELITPNSVYVKISKKDSNTTITTSQLEISEDKSTCSITGLEVDNTYTATISATYSKKSHVLYTFNFTTSKLGSEEQPQEITTVAEFKNMANDREGYFVLKNDLNFDGEKITPLFTSGKPFTGTFDGGSFKLANLAIKSTTHSESVQFTGIFGYNKGIIKNLNIEQVEIDIVRSSDASIGVVSGINYGTIENVHVKSSTLKVNMDASGYLYIGGITGQNSDKSKIINSSIQATINAKGRSIVRVGGVAGYNYSETSNARIENSNSNVDITATLDVQSTSRTDSYIYVGGIVGDNRNNVKSVYALGDITVSTNNISSEIKNDIVKVGGIVGYNVSGMLENAFASTAINFTSSKAKNVAIGGVVGDNNNRNNTKNVIYIPKFKNSVYDKIIITATAPEAIITVNGAIGNSIEGNNYVLDKTVIRINGGEPEVLNGKVINAASFNKNYLKNTVLLSEELIEKISLAGYTLS